MTEEQKKAIDLRKMLIEDVTKMKNAGFTDGEIGKLVNLAPSKVHNLIRQTNRKTSSGSTPPTAEREVLERRVVLGGEDYIAFTIRGEIYEDEPWTYNYPDVDEEEHLKYVKCPIHPQNFDEEGRQEDPCTPECAWFRIHNGLAMCGDKIIGKIIEPPKERETE